MGAEASVPEQVNLEQATELFKKHARDGVITKAALLECLKVTPQSPVSVVDNTTRNIAGDVAAELAEVEDASAALAEVEDASAAFEAERIAVRHAITAALKDVSTANLGECKMMANGAPEVGARPAGSAF